VTSLVHSALIVLISHLVRKKSLYCSESLLSSADYSIAPSFWALLLYTLEFLLRSFLCRSQSDLSERDERKINRAIAKYPFSMEIKDVMAWFVR